MSEAPFSIVDRGIGGKGHSQTRADPLLRYFAEQGPRDTYDEMLLAFNTPSIGPLGTKETTLQLIDHPKVTRNVSTMGEYSKDKGILPPLAIIGMSLRFPQEADSEEGFWDMLISRRCASTPIPPERMNIETFYHSDQSRLDSMSMKGGHFIKGDLAAFDAPFFSIGAAEAEAMDPCQRFTLEAAYRAIENAGIPLERLMGTRTCVFNGSFTNDYRGFLAKDPTDPPKYNTVGTEMSMLANRISWFFDLGGPSANVDTACSSSLMALDLVCHSIWNGDSTMGLACGSNLLFSPEYMATMDNLGFLSKDSRCFSFDSRASGYARGEGFGVLVIKPLQDALHDGDTIRAVLRSSASNQDGRTPTATQPSKDAQKRLIHRAYEKAGLDMSSTRYFEAHGTGTPVGDPIETGAIGSVFRSYRSKDEPLYVGSVKSNIGHLEGASGVAGVIKVILALERGLIPPNANFERLNPRIDAEFLNLKIPTQIVPWPSRGLRRASVQSFGFGGSNSHVIIDDAYNFLLIHGLKGNHNTVPEPPLESGHLPSVPNDSMNGYTVSKAVNGLSSPSTLDSSARLLVWSSADEGGIARLKDRWREYLANLATLDKVDANYLRDLAYTLGNRRTHLPWRTYAVVGTGDSIEGIADRITAPTNATSPPKLGFVFTGQGAQWYAMGRELLDRYPVFRRSLEEGSLYLKSLGCSWNLIHELLQDKETTNVNDAEYGQPLCTALQVALVDLLESFDVRPAAVVGHSSGEIAAAYAANMLSRQSAWKVAYFRGKVASKLEQAKSTSKFGMLSVGLSQDGAVPYLKRVFAHFGCKRLDIACVNSPKNLTISGDAIQLDQLEALLQPERIFSRRLKVNVAYHSFQMREIADEYLSLLGTLQSRDLEQIPSAMVSSVTGTWTGPDTVSAAEYWVKNMLHPVQFSDALAVLCSPPTSNAKKLDGSHHRMVSINQLVEVGPHGALQGPSRDILSSINREKDIGYMSVLKRGASAIPTMLETAGRLHCMGYRMNLACINNLDLHPSAKSPLRTLTDLPEYSFNHTKKYWRESRISRDSRFRRFGRMDLLGTPSPDWNPLQAHWRNRIRIAELPWVKDHKINDVTLYPAMGMVAMALEAAKQLADTSRVVAGFTLKDVSFHLALKIPTSDDGIEVCTYLRPKKKNTDRQYLGLFDFSICAYDGERWSEHCDGSVYILYKTDPSEVDGGKESEARRKNHIRAYGQLAKKCTTAIDVGLFYDVLARCGYGYGPAFQCITDAAYDGVANIISEIKTFQWFKKHEAAGVAQPHIIHPTTFDAILHSIFTVFTNGGTEMMPTSVPTHIGRLWLSADGLSHPNSEFLKVYANTAWTGPRESKSTITVLDPAGHDVLLEIHGAITTVVGSAGPVNRREQKIEPKFYNIDWKPDLDLHSPEALQAFCDSSVPSEDEPVAFYTSVNQALIGTAQLIVSGQKGKPLPNADLKPYANMYLEWMESRLRALDGNVPVVSSSSFPESSVPESVSKIATINKEGMFFASICGDLHKLVTGQIDTPEILSQGDLVRDYSYELMDSLPCVKRLRNYLDAYVHKNPVSKILEVGAGNGAMTHQAMKPLLSHGDGEHGSQRYSTYHYTDISTASFQSVEKNYKEQSDRMQFKALNIEVDPEREGFECGTYDIVIASMVLHATANLETALANCRKLLKEGGKLILLEATRPDALRATFACGLMDSWWMNSETYRKESAWVDEKKWNELLKQTGFTGSEIVLHDYEDPTCHEYSVIVTTACPEVQSANTNVDLVVIHSPGQEQIAQDIHEAAQADGKLPTQLATLEQALDKEHSPETVFAILLEATGPIWSTIDSDLFVKLQKLLTSSSKVLWVNQGGGFISPAPEYHMVDGLFRVLNSELGNGSFTSLALDTQGQLSKTQIRHILQLARLLSASPDIDTEYVEHRGMLHIHRLIPASNLDKMVYEHQLPQQKQRQRFGAGVPLRLEAGVSGALNSLKFTEDSGRESDIHPYEVEIKVQAVGLTYRDIQIALGRRNQSTIGTECVGTITRVGRNCHGFSEGMRVAAVCPDSFKNFVRLDHRAVAKIPNCVPLSTAAAIPINYSTAWHSLQEIARLQPGETVLIHSAAGGTGQAAIQVAQHLGATVFATVGTAEKKDLLVRKYKIPAEHIFSSRDTVFLQGIKRLTYGVGVDVVLNSLTDQALVASWECIAPYGRFVELGTKDIALRSMLQMSQFAQNVTFTAVDIVAMSMERPHRVRKALDDIFSLLEMGILAPAEPLRMYGVSELETAFKEVRSDTHFGKTVIKFRDDDSVEALVDTKPSFYLSPDATYVIAGGLGGLGRNVTRWFVKRGARHLILLSRSGAKSSDAQAFIAELTSQGACVRAPACNIADVNALKVAFDECLSDMPPVKGCIQSSMVLRDGTFNTMQHESWKGSTLPKVQGSWNLHTLLPRGMDFFVMFSSISGIFGNRGQSNYAAGNTYLDALARYRVSIGERGSSIDLGMVLSAGVLSGNEDLLSKFRAKSFLNPMKETELFALMDYYCNRDTHTSDLRACQTVVLDIAADLREHNADAAYWINKPAFRQIVAAGNGSADETAVQRVNFKGAFTAASSLTDAINVVTKSLVEKVASLLSLVEAEIHTDKPMHDYGVDSLVAIDLRDWFVKEVQADIAIFDILGGTSMASISALAAAKSKYRRPEWAV